MNDFSDINYYSKSSDDNLHNIDAEQALLGALLVNNEALHMCKKLEPDHFFETIHRDLYRIISGMVLRGKKATPVTIQHYCKELEPPGSGMSVSDYVIRLVAGATTVINAPDYASVITENFVRREIATATGLMGLAVNDPGLDSADILDDAVAHFGDLRDSHSHDRKTLFTAQEAADNLLHFIDSEDDMFWKTGLGVIDKQIGGLQKNEFVILAGRPAMGKSAIAISLARSMAMQGIGVGFFSAEMPAHVLQARILTDLAYSSTNTLEYQAVLQKKMPVGQGEKLVNAYKKWRKVDAPLQINDKSQPSIADIRAGLKKMRRRNRVDVIFLDHIGLMRASSRYSGQKTAEMEELTAQCMALAKEEGVTVVGLSQLNRKLEERNDKRPQMADLRQSGSIEQDACQIFFAFRPHYYLSREKNADPEQLESMKNTLYLDCAKNRNGATQNFKLFAHMGANAIRDSMMTGRGYGQ